jgi:hypothetical protein
MTVPTWLSGVTVVLGLAIPALSAAEVTTERVSIGSGSEEGNNQVLAAVPRGDGAMIALIDDSSNFPPNNPDNAHLNTEVFIRDRAAGTLTGLEVHSDSSVSGHMPIRFTRDGSTLIYGVGDMAISVWAYRMADGDNSRVSLDSSYHEALMTASATGRYVVTMVMDESATSYHAVTVIDRTTPSRETFEIASGETLIGNAAISENGRIVAYSVYPSTGSTTTVHIRDRSTNLTATILSAGQVSLSDDGRWLAYTDVHTVPSQVQLADLSTGTTRLVSATSSGSPGNGDSYTPAISGDGAAVAFVSKASNLVAGDANGHADVFRFDRAAGTMHLMSVSSAGVAANGDSSSPSVNRDGTVVAYLSDASNLVAGDTLGIIDAFVGTAAISSASSSGTTTGSGTGTTTGSGSGTGTTSGTGTGGSTDGTTGSSTGTSGDTGGTASSTRSDDSGGCGLGGMAAATATALMVGWMRRRFA